MSNKNYNEPVNSMEKSMARVPKQGQGPGEKYDMSVPKNPLGQIIDAYKSGKKREKEMYGK